MFELLKKMLVTREINREDFLESILFTVLTLSPMTILESSKLKEIVDNNFNI